MIQQHPQQYGVPWVSTVNGLSNCQIGGTGGGTGRVVDVYHRAAVSKTLSNITLFIKTGTGYSGGTGGSVKVEVQSDNGSGLPSGSVLATQTVTTPITTQLTTWTFPGGLAQTAGTLYHYVITNTDAAPATNFVSTDDLDLISSADIKNQKGSLPADCGILVNDNGGGWGLGIHYPGCFDLQYSDGSHDGIGIIDVVIALGTRDIGTATSAVRLNFTPSQSMLVNRVNAAFYKQASSSVAIDAELYQGAAKIAAGQIASASVPQTNPNWVGCALPQTPLQRGVNYTLQLWSRTETVVYKMFPIQMGGSGFGALFLSDSIFNDGYWEYTTDGSTWNLQGASTLFKPPIYFETINAPSARGGRAGAVYA